MKQNQNNIDCTPSKDEEGVAKCLIQMCKDTDSVVTFYMVCEGGYEVRMTARDNITRMIPPVALK